MRPYKLKYQLLSIIGFLVVSCSSNLPEEVSVAYKQLPEQIDFNYQVRPILSDRCYACHGPDEKARKANLRLDNQTDAFAALKEGTGHAFIPHQPFKSQAVNRILSTEPDIIMPTPSSKLVLWANYFNKWQMVMTGKS